MPRLFSRAFLFEADARAPLAADAENKNGSPRQRTGIGLVLTPHLRDQRVTERSESYERGEARNAASTKFTLAGAANPSLSAGSNSKPLLSKGFGVFGGQGAKKGAVCCKGCKHGLS